LVAFNLDKCAGGSDEWKSSRELHPIESAIKLRLILHHVHRAHICYVQRNFADQFRRVRRNLSGFIRVRHRNYREAACTPFARHHSWSLRARNCSLEKPPINSSRHQKKEKRTFLWHFYGHLPYLCSCEHIDEKNYGVIPQSTISMGFDNGWPKPRSR
jgi:hypothetical protein